MQGEGAPYEELTGTEEKKRDWPDQIDPKLKLKAKELYLAYVNIKEICELLGLKYGTVKCWSKREGWSYERAEAGESDLKEIIETKKVQLALLVTEIINGTLKAVRRDSKGDGFKAKDVSKYMAALSSIEKLSRLSLGQATSISEERTKRANFTLPAETLKQISQVKVADPFMTEANGTVQSADSTRDGSTP